MLNKFAFLRVKISKISYYHKLLANELFLVNNQVLENLMQFAIIYWLRNKCFETSLFQMLYAIAINPI